MPAVTKWKIARCLELKSGITPSMKVDKIGTNIAQIKATAAAAPLFRRPHAGTSLCTMRHSE